MLYENTWRRNEYREKKTGERGELKLDAPTSNRERLKNKRVMRWFIPERSLTSELFPEAGAQVWVSRP